MLSRKFRECSLILVLSVAVAYAAYIGYRLFFRKGLKSSKPRKINGLHVVQQKRLKFKRVF